MGLFSSPKFNPKGKFCYIPGGSAGLGKALAEELVRRGAHVVIVARGAARAAETVSGLKKIAGDDNERKIFAVSADLSSHEESERALNDACAAFGGRAPDYTFLSAGFTIPKLFISATPEELKHVS
jgi:3-dehydrosphinganine reductase